MDARKIQFLIGMQREIDKLEANEGNTPKVERVKSRFYDVVEVDKIIEEKDGQSIILPANTSSTNRQKTTKYTDYTKLCPHHPKFVTNFLKNFRRVNETGLRELVHPPYDEEGFDLLNTFKKIEDELFPEKPDYSAFSKEDRIPYFLWVHIRKDLMDVYKNYGLPYWETTKRHPLFNQDVLTSKVSDFIKSIRFGRDTSIETNFRELFSKQILAVIGQQYPDGWLIEDIINFQPNPQQFDASMVLMTDVIRIQFAITSILRLNIQKSNWKGEPINQANIDFKRLDISANYTKNNDKELVTILTVTDVGSWCNKHADYLFESGDLQGIAQNLWSLCEWEIIARFADGETYKLDILNSIRMTDKIIQKLDYQVSGFTHQFTFYH